MNGKENCSLLIALYSFFLILFVGVTYPLKAQNERVRVLHEVSITRKSKARQVHESAMPVTVINMAQIQSSVSSINEVLARTAGVSIRSVGGIGGRTHISLRGLGGKRIGIFVDEYPIGELQDNITLDDIPVDMIERIEVYKGIVPNKLGGSSMAGAVNIVLKEYPPIYLDATSEMRSFGTYRFNTVLKRHIPKWGLEVGAGGTLTQSQNDYMMELPQYDNKRVRRDHNFYRNYVLGGSLKLTNHYFDEVKLELLHSDVYKEIQGVVQNIRQAYNTSKTDVATLTLKKDNFLFDGLDLDMSNNIALFNYGIKDLAKERTDWDGKHYPTSSKEGGEIGSVPQDGKNKSLAFLNKTYLSYNINEHHRISTNLFLATTRQRPQDDAMEHALGYKVLFPSRITTLTLGTSYELNTLNNRLQSVLTGKLYNYRSHAQVATNFGFQADQAVRTNKMDWGVSEAVRYHLSPHWLVKASAGYDVRMPSVEELIGDGYSVMPALNLNPERNLSFNLGAIGQWRWSDDRSLEIDVNTFYSYVRDMIHLTHGLAPGAEYANFGQMRSMGIEGEIKSDITPYCYTYLNATFQDLRDARKLDPGTERPNPTQGLRMPNIPYLLANAGVELHRENLFGGRGHNTRLMLDASYIHRYSFDFVVSRYQERYIPTAFTIDMALEHSFQNRRWTVSLNLKNLTNRNMYTEFFQPLPGFNWGVKLRYLLR